MDSVTQITLGAAVGEAVLGRQLGNRAILWGAAFGTLPDLDVVFSPLLDPVGFIVHHRALSHSLLLVAVATPLFSSLFVRWYRNDPRQVGYWRWFAFFFLVLLTHIVLDCCTNYGTQIFTPFSDARIAWSNIFIIDPLYTIPFLSCVIACLFFERTSPWRRRINYCGLALSTGYLVFTFAVKTHVERVFADSLAESSIEVSRFMTCPTPLNSILWYGVAESDQGYQVGFYSLFDSERKIEFEFIPRNEELLGDLAETYEVDRLTWFANNYYCVRPHEEGLLLHVMNFGKLDFGGDQQRYPFTYLLVEKPNPGVVVKSYAVPHQAPLGQLFRKLWTRLKGI